MAKETDLLPWDTEDEIINQDKVFDLQAHHEPAEIDMEFDDSLQMWQAVEAYHNMGFSMMWGRAENDPVKKKKAKSPLVTTWSSEIESKFTLEALASMMHKEAAHIRIAPIIICGKASGNLIVIDVDVKHMPGIDAKFLLAIQETYPQLYKIIRRHRTPSKGVHLLYRTAEHVEFPSKNPGLAYPKEGKMAGIESRTHGGYVLAPPGMGYTVEYDVEVPTISVHDHECLFNLARIFNERQVVKNPPRQKQYDSVYDQNPFEHFNSSMQAENVLKNNGWDFDYENTQFTHYTRPGKGGGVSASWHREKRFYHFFTTSTEIDTSKWNGNYSAANVRCILEFNNDWKRFYKVLCDEGFGKHKAEYEKKVIENRKQTGKPLPKNFSEEAKQQLEVAIVEKSEKYPHGTFWEFNISTENYLIQRQRLAVFMEAIGLRLHNGEPCIIEGQFIRKLKEDKNKNGARDVYNVIKSWIKEEEEDVFLKISHEFSKFWQASGQFMVTTLTELDENQLLKTNSKTCYKFFSNCILTITKDEIKPWAYRDHSTKLIWAEEVIDREFHYVNKEQQAKSMYVDFLGKALVTEADYVQLCIGFLACGYKSPDESYFIILQEPRETEKGGGSGKGYFCKALAPWTSVLVTNAEAVKKDVDQLIQNWNGEKIVHLSDLPEWIRLSNLKNVISDDSQRKLLYKDIINVKSEDMPKFVGSTQWGLDIKSDGGVAGRVRELAFSDYFGRNYNRISDEYGGHCPDIWDGEGREECQDWNGYFSYMADAVKLYLGKKKIEVKVNMGLWLKGFDVRFSNGNTYLRDAIVEQVPVWAKLDQVPVQMVIDWYEEFCKKNNVAHNRRLGVDKVQSAIREYGLTTEKFDYKFGEAMGVKREYDNEGKQIRVVKIKMLEMGDEWDKVQEDPPDDDLPF